MTTGKRTIVCVLLFVLLVLLAFTASSQLPQEGIEEPERLAEIREEYPEFFDVPSFKGLEIYVTQFAEGGRYSFTLMPGTNRMKSVEELMHMRFVSAEDMKLVLSTYDIGRDDLIIIPWQHPLSSYIGEFALFSEESIRTHFIEKIRDMLLDEE